MKVVVVLSLAVLVGLSVFVSAVDWAGEGAASFNKGWNLIYGFMSPDQIQALEKSDIKAVYAFIPTTQKYVRLYPDREFNAFKDIDDDEVSQMALWVYSDKTVDGVFNGIVHGGEYWLYDLPNPYTQRQLYKGWNFIGITMDMTKKTFNNIKGNCEIIAAHGWNSEFQRWVTEKDLMNSYIPTELIGQGMVMKVASDCKLGESGTSSGLVSPPPIPTQSYICTDSDGGVVIDVKGHLEDKTHSAIYDDHCLDSVSEEMARQNGGNGVNEGKILVEYSCGKQNYGYDYFDCSQRGFAKCNNGACIN